MNIEDFKENIRKNGSNYLKTHPQETIAKIELAILINNIIHQKNLTQVQAAELMGIDQPKVSAILKGQLSGFSIDRLFRFLMGLGIDLIIEAKPRQNHKKPNIHIIQPHVELAIKSRNTNCKRIIKNINDLSKIIKSLETENNMSLLHFQIISQNLEVLDISFKKVELYNEAFNQQESALNLETWFDVCYWMNHLGAFIENVSLLTHPKESVMHMLIRDIGNLSMGICYILCRFIQISSSTQIPCVWLEADQLRDKLMELTKLILLRIFSLVENFIIDSYEDMQRENIIKKIEPRIQNLTKLWNKLKEEEKLSSQQTKDIDNELEKLAKSDRPDFINIIRHITEKLLDSNKRKSQIQEWIFLIHLRNSFMHKGHKATVDCKMSLWGRDFILKKGKPIACCCDQFIVFSVRIVQLLLELFGDLKDNKEWAKIQERFLMITPHKDS